MPPMMPKASSSTPSNGTPSLTTVSSTEPSASLHDGSGARASPVHAHGHAKVSAAELDNLRASLQALQHSYVRSFFLKNLIFFFPIRTSSVLRRLRLNCSLPTTTPIAARPCRMDRQGDRTICCDWRPNDCKTRWNACRSRLSPSRTTTSKRI